MRSNKHNKKSFWWALLFILPLVLLVYENLAKQNNHPSLVGSIKHLFSTNENQLQQELPANAKPVKKKKVINKLSIKSVSKSKKAQDKKQDQRVKSAQIKKKDSGDKKASKEKSLVEGTNSKGKLKLPNMIIDVEGEISEALLVSLLLNNKAELIAHSEEGGVYRFELEDNKISSGRFLGVYDIKNISDGVLSLPVQWKAELQSYYEIASLSNSSPTIELRLAKNTYQHLVSQQIEAQSSSTKQVKETVFGLRLGENGIASFALKEVEKL